MQERTVYLPFDTHQLLREVRRLSFVHVWWVAVTPPQFLVYAICHIRRGILYIGVTNMAPSQRLRKHMTDTLAGVDCSSVPRIVMTTDMAGWGIAVLEYVDAEWWLGVMERAWWYTLKRWAVNNVAPRVGQGLEDRPNRWLNQKVLRLLKEMKQAQDGDEYPRVAAMRAELTKLSNSLNIPLLFGAFRLLNAVVCSTKLIAWGKQAVKRVVQVVQASSETVQTIFSKLATTQDWSTKRLAYTCKKHLETLKHLGTITDTVKGTRATQSPPAGTYKN